MVTSRTQVPACRPDRRADRIGHHAVGPDLVAQPPFGLRAEPRDVEAEVRIGFEPLGQPVEQATQRVGGIAMGEDVDGIVAPALRRVGVDLQERARQRHLVVARLVPAKTRADDEHEVGGAEELGGLGTHVEGAEAAGLVLGHHRAAVGRGHDAHAPAHEFRGLGFCPARTAAQPDQRAPGLAQKGRHLVDHGVRSAGAQRFGGVDHLHLGRKRALHVHRDLETDRPGRGRQRRRHRGGQRADRAIGVPHAVNRLRHAAQHLGLTRHVVDGGAVAVGIGEIDLAGYVQDRAAGRQCLGLRAGGIARRRAGRGDADAEVSRHAGIGVSHVHGPGLPPGGHEADAALSGDGVKDRHVVNRDDAEHGRHADLREVAGDEVAHRLGLLDGVVLHGACPHMCRDRPPETSSCAPVM
jgi:hypothetical protein